MRALLLILAACTTPPTPPPQVSPEGEWSGEVVDAAAEWTAIGCEIQISEGRPVRAIPEVDWPHETQYLGVTTPQYVDVVQDLDASTRHAVLLHELGHVLGFGHSTSGIMTARVTARALTPDDCQ